VDAIRKLYVQADRFARGQTMAEYALIVAAIAVTVVAAYQTFGGDVSTLVNSVDSLL